MLNKNKHHFFYSMKCNAFTPIKRKKYKAQCELSVWRR